MESEARLEEVYGKGVQLIVPEAGFVVKTTQKVAERAGSLAQSTCGEPLHICMYSCIEGRRTAHCVHAAMM